MGVCDLWWYIPEGSQRSETRVPGGLPALAWPSYTAMYASNAVGVHKYYFIKVRFMVEVVGAV